MEFGEEMTGKEAVEAYFKVISQHSHEAILQSINQDSRCIGRDSNRVPPAGKSEVFSPESTWSPASQ